MSSELKIEHTQLIMIFEYANFRLLTLLRSLNRRRVLNYTGVCTEIQDTKMLIWQSKILVKLVIASQ